MLESQTKRLKKFRRRWVYSIGFIVTDEINWTGVWFKKIEIIEEKLEVRYLKFDEWVYQHYWGEWETRWSFVKLAKNYEKPSNIQST